MSSTTVVRQTTTVTSSGSASIVSVSLNTTFLTSISGILTIVEMVLGIIVFSLGYHYFLFGTPSGFYLTLVSFAYWLICLYFLLSGALSITGSLLPTTFFFFLFHVFGFVLYMAGGIAVLVRGSNYSPAAAMGALGLIASVCHIAHVAFLYKGPKF